MSRLDKCPLVVIFIIAVIIGVVGAIVGYVVGVIAMSIAKDNDNYADYAAYGALTGGILFYLCTGSYYTYNCMEKN
jgi:hypothetical protein